jgi:signal transduction histidine kinase
MSTDASRPAEVRLAKLIEQQRLEIERRWLDRVQRDLAGGSGIEPTHLRDGLPDYLAALAQLLSSEDRNLSESAEPAWAKVAREHGITRVRIGFDLDQLIHEFIILRHVIREIAVEDGMAVGTSDSILADALDPAIATSANAYVEARNYEARRKQAENIGFLTHELRNPLAIAVLKASQLRRNAGADQVRYLDDLDRCLQQLATLIDSVLLTERLEAGKIESRPADVTLGLIMEPALEAARTVAAKKGIAFRVTFDADLPVRLDPLLTRSAIQNLADNAAKYVDSGQVDVAVEELPDGLVVHVRDTCAGISEEELRTIFEPFERGTTRKSGTGLGLAIARRAVEAQGGSIGAESPGMSGCHFWIMLPKHPETKGGLEKLP